jgi:drug/metabolite transporter (DMT)-like permease
MLALASAPQRAPPAAPPAAAPRRPAALRRRARRRAPRFAARAEPDEAAELNTLPADAPSQLDALHDAAADAGGGARVPLDAAAAAAPWWQSPWWVGNGYLLAVSILWGSYTPTLRALFTLPGAPSPLVAAAGRGALQAALLAAASVAAAVLAAPPAPGALDDEATTEPLEADNHSNKTSGLLPPATAGALEIGAYNTAGTLLQTWGLSLTGATRAAFLIQSSAIFTPVLSSLLGAPPPPALWASSLVALAGTVLVTLDAGEAAGGAAGAGGALAGTLGGALSLGDVATLGAALCYSLATVRLPAYAGRVPPLRLALGKSAVLAAGAGALLAARAATLAAGGADAAAELWPAASLSAPAAWALLGWSALGPGALGAYLHVKGQSMVGATDAQVAFATVPLWSALLAAVLLPGERVGPLVWAGGGAMLAAGLLAAAAQRGRAPAGPPGE